jgi:ubiquitin-protein ligase
MAWWGTRRDVSARLQLEVKAMRATFGSTFRLVVPESGDPLYWDGVVEINMARLRHREHRLKIVYPHEYPYKPAEAYLLDPKIISKKHQYVDGQLCLFNPREGERYGWNPAKSTAVTVTAWAIQWIYAYYTWVATEEWPGEEEFVDPNTPLNPRR